MLRNLTRGIIFYTAFLSIPCVAATLETERLIIRDVTGRMPPETLEKFGRKVDSTFTEVLKFWSAEPGIKKLGKIVVEFDYPFLNANTSVFYWGKEKGQKIRVVKVFGGNEYPYELAHKLTHAVFPNPDKLIRNMMGEASEMRFGNPLSFPMCGFDKDEWVMALLQAGSYISLMKIGPNHSDWGMEIENGAPKVKDRAKQHASYLEAGSFGEYLITTYGAEKIKKFSHLSRNTFRPWQEVFGITLEQLEAEWLEAVRLRSREKEEKISTLVKLRKNNPDTACFSAQDIAKGK